MGVRNKVESDSVATVSSVLSYVQTHLDDQIDPAILANITCFSLHHFHRAFPATVGESVMHQVHRLRLESAAFQLKNSPAMAGTIAFDDCSNSPAFAFNQMVEVCRSLWVGLQIVWVGFGSIAARPLASPSIRKCAHCSGGQVCCYAQN